MEPLLLHDEAARWLSRGILIAWSVIEFRLSLRTRKQTRMVSDPTYPVVIVASIVSIVGGYRLARVEWGGFGGGWWPVAIGLTILVLGIAFRTWAILALGRFFTFRVSILEGHHVVDDGPYAFVRHPGYTGASVACLGLGIALSSGLSIALLLLLPLVSTLIRIRVEERQLTDALGDEYRRYAARRARLVPFVW
jgi:protein-S-isoprenylcysteine O-methyltransferase Ste14